MMSSMDITIIVVNYQLKRFLTKCLASVFNQKTGYSYEVIVIDNASEDLQDLKKAFPQIILLTNTVNIGFTGGNNQGIMMSEAEHVMTLNPDVVLENNYIEKCLNELQQNKTLGSITGKLLYYNFEKSEKTDIIDSTGLGMKKTRHAYDRGQGEKDEGQFDSKQSVWGVSAAAAIYRRKALDEVKDKNGYFDNRFFMYKEDVDLAWRLHTKKWKARFIPSAIAYHRRGTGIINPKLSFFKKLQERKKTKSEEARALAYRNQRLMMLKNEGVTLHFVAHEIIAIVYGLLFERELLIKNSKQR